MDLMRTRAQSKTSILAEKQGMGSVSYQTAARSDSDDQLAMN